MASDHVCFIVPPYLLVRMIEEGHPETRTAAIRALAISERVRERRAVTRRLVQHDPQAAVAMLLPPAGVQRSAYDARNGSHGDLPGLLVRREGDPPAADPAVNQAYDGAGVTYDFYLSVFNRNSVDDQGPDLRQLRCVSC